MDYLIFSISCSIGRLEGAHAVERVPDTLSEKDKRKPTSQNINIDTIVKSIEKNSSHVFGIIFYAYICNL